MNVLNEQLTKETILAPTTRSGTLTRWDAHGCGFVESTGQQFGFTFDKVENYRGEPPKELGWRVGLGVSFTTCDGLTIKEIRINNETPNSNSPTPSVG